MKIVVTFLLFFVSTALYASNAHRSLNRACIENGRIICGIETIKRYQLENNIVHYEMVLSVGDGLYDKIGLHRIVKEKRSGRPIKSADAVMMVHGDAYGFGSFISSIDSQIVSHDHSIAIQMAASGIDVWGIDARWVKVPDDTPNLDFMANWGLDVNLRDLDVAINVARNIRRLKGNVNNKLNLLGWSRGGQLGYLYLAMETQRSKFVRNIKTFVPVDILLKTDDEAIRQSACLYSSILQEQIDSGKQYDDSGLILKSIAFLAQNYPDETSPVLEGLTNKQAVLVALTATYLTVPPGASYTSWYHYNGGQFDETGLPIGLTFSNLDYINEFARGAAPYEPARLIREATDLTCNTNAELDKHLKAISVPMLYVYSAGGFGKTGLYTAQLTASKDVSSFGVKTLPDDLAALDFAHVDLFTANDANKLVWQRIIRWIKNH